MGIFDSKEEKLRKLVEKREKKLAELREHAELYKQLNKQEEEYRELKEEQMKYERPHLEAKEEKLKKTLNTANKILNFIAPVESEKKARRKTRHNREAYA